MHKYMYVHVQTTYAYTPVHMYYSSDPIQLFSPFTVYMHTCKSGQVVPAIPSNKKVIVDDKTRTTSIDTYYLNLQDAWQSTDLPITFKKP